MIPPELERALARLDARTVENGRHLIGLREELAAMLTRIRATPRCACGRWFQTWRGHDQHRLRSEDPACGQKR